MPNAIASALHQFSVSPVKAAAALVATLAIAYIALIATAMSYAALTVQFSQSVRNDEASVAALESGYLDAISSITAMDYAAAGYVKPATLVYVPTAPSTALR